MKSRLQSKGTASAKRHLVKPSGKESGFRKDVNHCISKMLVQKAKDTHSSIVLEDLTGIRKATVRKSQRAKHSSWSFYQLKQFINYKALRSGVEVIFVNPANTSRECSICHCIDKKNRKGDKFKCIACGFEKHADLNSPFNIASRASVNKPIVTSNLVN